MKSFFSVVFGMMTFCFFIKEALFLMLFRKVKEKEREKKGQVRNETTGVSLTMLYSFFLIFLLTFFIFYYKKCEYLLYTLYILLTVLLKGTRKGFHRKAVNFGSKLRR